MGKRIHINDFKSEVFRYNVKTPNGEILDIGMRAPTQGELYDLQIGLPPRPEPPMGFTGTKKGNTLKYEKNYEDEAYQAALSQWLLDQMFRQVALCWDGDFEHDDLGSRAEELRRAPRWITEALYKCFKLVVGNEDETVTVREFHAD